MTTMFSRLFGNSKQQQQSTALATLDKLSETLEMLEKKENFLTKKAAQEVDRARQFTRERNKKSAILCLKRKKIYEQQIEQLGNFQLRIHDQIIMLESIKATTETVQALRSGATAMKAMHKSTNINDVDQTIDQINEQMEDMRQIQQAISTPIYGDIDEDELEFELENLDKEVLEAELEKPTVAPAVAPVRVPASQQQAGPAPQLPKSEEDELAELQADMAM